MAQLSLRSVDGQSCVRVGVGHAGAAGGRQYWTAGGEAGSGEAHVCTQKASATLDTTRFARIQLGVQLQ